MARAAISLEDRLWASQDPTSLRRNIELKTICQDLAAAKRAAVKLGAKRAAILKQTDTYFKVPIGRLKLRETAGKAATLIAYSRPNGSAARESRYRVVPVPNAIALKAALTDALGIRSIVRKQRTLYLYQNVRIHVDRVAGLGDFLELEAVVGSEPNTRAAASKKRLEEVARALAMDQFPPIRGSYGEMVRFKR